MARVIRTLGEAREAGLAFVAVCHGVQCRHSQSVDLNQVIYHVGAAHSLMPLRGAIHFSERMRCPKCKSKGMSIWAEIKQDPEPLVGSMGFSINNWDKMSGSLIGTIAKAGHVTVAEAAFNMAVSQYPGRRITLQEGGLVLRDNRLTVIKGGRC